MSLAAPVADAAGRDRAGGAPRLLVAATVPVTLRAFLTPLAAHFRAQGWRVDCAARGAPGDAACRAAFDEAWDVPWSRQPLDPRNLLGAARQVRRVVRREGYDLVHVHTPVAAFVTRYALRDRDPRRGPGLVYTAHGFHFHPHGSAWRNAAFRGLERLAGRWTDYLVVMNEEDEAAARAHRIVPPERLRRMPGIGLDLAHYARERVDPAAVEAVRARLGLAPGDRLLVMAAEFVPRKRHEDALRAFARLGRADAHLALTSDGPLRPRIEALAGRLGVRERVHFLGFTDDLRPLLVAADAALLPSEQEGLPRIVMECLALGTPVVATRIRGTRELLRGSEELLVEVGDAEALAGAIRGILDRPEEARRIADVARRRMDAYALPRVLRLHEALYAEALPPMAR